jgi:hypothetical protein
MIDSSLRQYWLAKHVREMLLQEEILRFLEVLNLLALLVPKRVSIYLLAKHVREMLLQEEILRVSRGILNLLALLAQKALTLLALLVPKRFSIHLL